MIKWVWTSRLSITLFGWHAGLLGAEAAFASQTLGSEARTVEEACRELAFRAYIDDEVSKVCERAAERREGGHQTPQANPKLKPQPPKPTRNSNPKPQNPTPYTLHPAP